jgi:hypothetical protein
MRALKQLTKEVKAIQDMRPPEDPEKQTLKVELTRLAQTVGYVARQLDTCSIGHVEHLFRELVVRSAQNTLRGMATEPERLMRLDLGQLVMRLERHIMDAEYTTADDVREEIERRFRALEDQLEAERDEHDRRLDAEAAQKAGI